MAPTDAAADVKEVTTVNKYRTDQYGSVFEYCPEKNCYLFAGKLNGRTLEQFIRDIEQQPVNEEDEDA
jgi:hypothetical protein